MGQEELTLLLASRLLPRDLSESPGSSSGSPLIPLLPVPPCRPGTPLETSPAPPGSQDGGSSCMWKRDNFEVMTENPSRQNVYSFFILLRGSTGGWRAACVWRILPHEFACVVPGPPCALPGCSGPFPWPRKVQPHCCDSLAPPPTPVHSSCTPHLTRTTPVPHSSPGQWGVLLLS